MHSVPRRGIQLSKYGRNLIVEEWYVMVGYRACVVATIMYVFMEMTSVEPALNAIELARMLNASVVKVRLTVLRIIPHRCSLLPRIFQCCSRHPPMLC